MLTVDNRPVDLLTEESDVSIRIGPLRDSELIARKLGTMALLRCAVEAHLNKPGCANLNELGHVMGIGSVATLSFRLRGYGLRRRERATQDVQGQAI